MQTVLPTRRRSPRPDPFNWLFELMNVADPLTFDRIGRALEEMQAGFASRPDALVDELLGAGEHRLAFFVRGTKLMRSEHGDYRDALARAIEFLPAYDDPANAAFPERTCFLRSVGCILSRVDRVGYAPRIAAIAQTVLAVDEAGDCCRTLARIDLAAHQRERGLLEEAEALLQSVEAGPTPGDAQLAALTKARFRLDLRRGDLVSARARLAWLDARPVSQRESADAAAERIAERLTLRATLLLHEGDDHGATGAVRAALKVNPDCVPVASAALRVVRALRASERTTHGFRLAELATDLATRRGLARAEVELRLEWLGMLADHGYVTEAQTVAAGLDEAVPRLASQDLLDPVRAARHRVGLR